MDDQQGFVGADAAKASAAAPDAQLSTPSRNPGGGGLSEGSEIVCARPVPAYSPFNTAKVIGQFLKGTRLTVGVTDQTTGMIHVSFRRPKGAPIHAVCRSADLAGEAGGAAGTSAGQSTSQPAPALEKYQWKNEKGEPKSAAERSEGQSTSRP